MNRAILRKRLMMLTSVLLVYGALYLVDSTKTAGALGYALGIMWDILPILGIIYVFMVAFNFIPEKRLKASIQKTQGLTQYLILSLLGMISHGPIYAWYPLLSDLRKRGLTQGSVATYLFSKGIKLTMIPITAYYFGLPFTLVFSLTLFILSFVQGILVDLLMRDKTERI